MSNSRAVRTAAALCCFAVFFLFSGCSLPRIIILNDPLSAEEHINLGKIYQAQGKLDLAGQQFREALKKDAKSLPALLLIGDLSLMTKKYSEAESAYRKAISIQPENGDIYNNLCWVYLEQNVRLDEAGELVGKAIAATPAHLAYYLDTRGVILLKQGKPAEAIADFKKAIQLLQLLPPEDADYLNEAYRHLADAFRAVGETSKAEEAEQSADRYRVQIDPGAEIESVSESGKQAPPVPQPVP